MRRLSAAVALALLVAPWAACVSDDLPARPSVDAGALDGEDAPDGSDGGALPVQLAATPGCGSMNLVVAAGTLYWTEKGPGRVRSISTSGGSITDIESAQVAVGALAVDDTSIFWVAGGGKVVMKKALAGGAATVLVPATAVTVPNGNGMENLINALLVDSGTLFFGRFTDAERVPTTGGDHPLVIGHSPQQDNGRPGAFALGGNYLYQTEIVHYAVSRELIDGNQDGFLEGGVTKVKLAPDRIAVSQGSLVTDAIAVVDGNVYWADDSAIHEKQGDLPEQAGYAVVVTQPEFNPITGFVLSGGAVYFGVGKENDVEMAPVGTDAVTVVATNQLNAGQFAADDENVYWRTSDCKIMKLAR